jgi:hypothetical protein
MKLEQSVLEKELKRYSEIAKFAQNNAEAYSNIIRFMRQVGEHGYETNKSPR